MANLLLLVPALFKKRKPNVKLQEIKGTRKALLSKIIFSFLRELKKKY